MASQYTPDVACVLDPGTAPEIFVDGLAYYGEDHGIVRSAYFTIQPGVDGDHETRKVLSLRLVCTVEVQRQMRLQALAVAEKARGPIGEPLPAVN